MKTYRSIGTICVKGDFDLVYSLCTIEYILNDDGTWVYLFRPNYFVTDLISSRYYQGIPGLNMDLRKEEYRRENMNPCFISERVPSPRREDYDELLAEVGLDYMDPIEFLIRTKKRYSGDKYFVTPYKEKENVQFESLCGNKTNAAVIKQMLVHICRGDSVAIGKQLINDYNRHLVHDILIELYARSFECTKEKQKEGIERAKATGIYKGRKPIHVDYLLFLDVLEKIKKKQMTPKEAAVSLHISIDKFYREKKRIAKLEA